MIGARTGYADFSEMPPALQAFVFSQQFQQADQSIQQTHHLSDEQMIVVGDRVMDALFHRMDVSQAVTAIRAKLVPAVITETGWKDFVVDFVKLEIWPLRELFGDELTKVLDEHKISTAGWPEFRVLVKPVTYSGAASEIATRLGMGLLAQHLHDRLRDLIMSLSKGVRTEIQVKEVLARQADMGGLGFDAPMSEKVMDAIKEVLATVEVLSEEEYADRLVRGTQKKVAAEDASAAGAPLEDEDAEIVQIKANMPKVAAGASSVLDQAVETTFASLSNKPTDDYLAKRLRYLISSRFRDVRNVLELKQLLMRDMKVGGMGTTQTEADGIALQIEQSYTTFHSAIMEDEKKKLDTQMQEQKIKIDERKRRDAEEHAKWYQEKILSRKKAEDNQQQLAERMRQTFAASHPIDAKEQKTEKDRFGEMVPQNTPTDTTRPEIKVSKATAVLQAANAVGKPRVDDVMYGGPRLSGPIQELKSMTVSEFRRLAKDPDQAAEKILQRIELLRHESLERRIEGIKALQASPLQRAYVQLMSEAFQSAKPVAQLAEEKKIAGQESLSPGEIAAVISLNSKLHF